MKISFILATLLLVCLLALARAQTDSGQPKITFTQIDGNVPGAHARIVEYHVDKAGPGSGYETGSLHILYGDNTEVVVKLPPKQKTTEDSVVFNEEGISDPKVANDHRTIAWTGQFDNYGTSYSIPLVLAVYRSGKIIVEIQQGQMIWSWMFLEGGKRVAAVWGPVHLSDVGDYQLYDTETGRTIDEVLANAEVEGKNGTVHGLGPGAPAWAKELERLQENSR